MHPRPRTARAGMSFGDIFIAALCVAIKTDGERVRAIKEEALAGYFILFLTPREARRQ